MILGSYLIEDPRNIVWTIVMNMEIIDWDNSKIPESYFVDKLKYLNHVVGKYYTADFKVDNSIKGAADLKRTTVHTNQDYVIFLDSDLFFSYVTLPHIINASKFVEQGKFIISPQIIKYWDDSWDVIVHDKFLKEPHNHRDNFDLHSLNELVTNNEYSLKSNFNIKFGAGWFNLLSDQLIKAVPIPEELGSYGPDDTYYAYCGMRLKVPQYILEGVVVSEIGNSFLENKDYLKKQLVSKITDKSKISDQEFNNLIRKFYESN
jgi:hypothetical protein